MKTGKYQNTNCLEVFFWIEKLFTDRPIDLLVSRLIYWLTARWTGLLTDWLTGWMAGWLTGWLARWPTGRLESWLTDWPTETWLNNSLIDQLSCWLTSLIDGLIVLLGDRLAQLVDWLTDWLTYCLINWLTILVLLTNSLSYWLIDWLTYWP